MSEGEVAFVLICWAAACGLTPLFAGRFVWGFGLAAIGLFGILSASIFNLIIGLSLWLGALFTGLAVAYHARRAVPKRAFKAERMRY